MKHILPKMVLLSVAFLLAGCGSGATAVPSSAPGVEDEAGLIAALESAGATVEVGDVILQDFFAPEGRIVTINGQDVQVFEYETAEAMEAEALQVAPDGGSVGTSMMMWIDTPHFYKAGRIIVLYVGSSQDVLALLEEVIGPQFAGR